MSELRDFYQKLGHDVNYLESSPNYLLELALAGATEIDNNILGRNNDFSHVQELAGILRKYKLNDKDDLWTTFTSPFSYFALSTAINKGTDKRLINFPELALEMRLLTLDLESIPSNPKRLEELREFLLDLSQEFLSEQLRRESPIQTLAVPT